MAKYRKLTDDVDAIQWNGQNLGEILYFIFDPSGNSLMKTFDMGDKINIGDYIIKGSKGNFYNRNPDIFKSTYKLIK